MAVNRLLSCPTASPTSGRHPPTWTATARRPPSAVLRLTPPVAGGGARPRRCPATRRSQPQCAAAVPQPGHPELQQSDPGRLLAGPHRPHQRHSRETPPTTISTRSTPTRRSRRLTTGWARSATSTSSIPPGLSCFPSSGCGGTWPRPTSTAPGASCSGMESTKRPAQCRRRPVGTGRVLQLLPAARPAGTDHTFRRQPRPTRSPSPGQVRKPIRPPWSRTTPPQLQHPRATATRCTASRPSGSRT